MNKKYTVITKNEEFSIVEVVHVKAVDPQQAIKIAINQTNEEFFDEGDHEKSFNNKEVICVLEDHFSLERSIR